MTAFGIKRLQNVTYIHTLKGSCGFTGVILAIQNAII